MVLTKRREEEEEEDDLWGPRVSDRREGLQCNIRIRVHLQLSPGCLHTYSVAFLWEAKNCNGMFRNRRIVMVFLQTSKIVMVWIQKTTYLSRNLHANLIYIREDGTGTGNQNQKKKDNRKSEKSLKFSSNLHSYLWDEPRNLIYADDANPSLTVTS